MNHAAAKKNTAPPAAAVKKKPTTLLDAYEVACIRRELERLVHKQNGQQISAVGKGAPADGHQHRHHGGETTTTTTTGGSRKVKVKVSPSTTKGARHGGGVRLLGRHAVAICRGAAPVSAGGERVVIGGGGRRRGGYREVEKV